MKDEYGNPVPVDQWGTPIPSRVQREQAAVLERRIAREKQALTGPTAGHDWEAERGDDHER